MLGGRYERLEQIPRALSRMACFLSPFVIPFAVK